MSGYSWLIAFVPTARIWGRSRPCGVPLRSALAECPYGYSCKKRYEEASSHVSVPAQNALERDRGPVKQDF